MNAAGFSYAGAARLCVPGPVSALPPAALTNPKHAGVVLFFAAEIK